MRVAREPRRDAVAPLVSQGTVPLVPPVVRDSTPCVSLQPSAHLNQWRQYFYESKKGPVGTFCWNLAVTGSTFAQQGNGGDA
jgi:hypothetical protein